MVFARGVRVVERGRKGHCREGMDRGIVEKWRRELLKRNVGGECCTDMFEMFCGRFVEQCWRKVSERALQGSVGEVCYRDV